MTKQEVLDFLNANPVCFLATVEGTAPRVRGMMLGHADEQGITFHSGKGKDMIDQLEKNSQVEICAFNAKDNVQVRVDGTVEFIDDLAAKKALVAQLPFLQPMVEQTGGYDFLVIFRIKPRTACVWTMAAPMEPKTLIAM